MGEQYDLKGLSPASVSMWIGTCAHMPTVARLMV